MDPAIMLVDVVKAIDNQAPKQRELSFDVQMTLKHFFSSRMKNQSAQILHILSHKKQIP